MKKNKDVSDELDNVKTNDVTSYLCTYNTPHGIALSSDCDNDDDEDSIPLQSQKPESPTKEPVNSLSLGDEHLDTIPATESDEFIKSSVENLVPTPIEFEDFSDDECDLPSHMNILPRNMILLFSRHLSSLRYR
ncbi:hypothetical protein Tco_0550599 [Tanacetum coccineum]|uniref:Uncharacterized protein n=1 Tax=Tanacetum coccineum TaxID=301880 RepID=A0ABQ5ICB5_9ASTR